MHCKSGARRGAECPDSAALTGRDAVAQGGDGNDEVAAVTDAATSAGASVGSGTGVQLQSQVPQARRVALDGEK